VRTLRIHDTLSGEVVPVEPGDGRRIGIYACGPTVYGRIHVGNARPYVVFSLLKRFLEHEGYDTTLVVNITDVNDKIYDAARERGVPSAELAREMTAGYVEDTDRLGLGRPDEEPKATETIAAIVALIQDLVDSGHAYERGGDVYFRVASFDGYGKLSNRPLEEMQQGEGDDAAELKEAPQDFALWKARKEGEDTWWESPWGDGRPGWHIECSAMAEEVLGVPFEIHGGGSDLVFPHHENEIAQTEAARSRPLSRAWMHNGMVQMGEEKMAKSVGNIRLLHGALDEFGRDAFVMWMVGTHYRKPVAYTEEALEDAARAVERVRDLIRRLDPQGTASHDHDQLADAFFDALSDDFNTAQARAILFDWVAVANRQMERGRSVAPGRLPEMLHAVGLEGLMAGEEEAPEELQRLADEREEARASRDFDHADRIREQLADAGWEIRDTPEGARLVRAPPPERGSGGGGKQS
jgi:cysteinyl-tRNA synthetase